MKTYSLKGIMTCLLLLSLSSIVSADDEVVNTTDEYINYTHTVYDAQMEKDRAALLDSLTMFMNSIREIQKLQKGQIQNEAQRATLQLILDVMTRKYTKEDYNLTYMVEQSCRGSINDTDFTEKIQKDIDKGKINTNLVKWSSSVSHACEIVQYDLNEQKRGRRQDGFTERYKKTITEQIKNPFNHLYIPDVGSYGENQVPPKWEWASSTNNLERVDKSYPVEVTYWISKDHPEYAIRECFAYDMTGKLVYGIDCPNYLITNSYLDYIYTKIYQIDYKNNKYNIFKEPEATQLYIKHRLGLEKNAKAEKEYNNVTKNLAKSVTAKTKTQKKQADLKAGAAAFNMAFGDYDSKGSGFLQQLKTDHSGDLRYLDTKRITDVTFKLIFIDSKGQSTYTAVAKYVCNSPFKAHAEILDIKEDKSIKYTIMYQSEVDRIQKQLKDGTYEPSK